MSGNKRLRYPENHTNPELARFACIRRCSEKNGELSLKILKLTLIVYARQCPAVSQQCHSERQVQTAYYRFDVIPIWVQRTSSKGTRSRTPQVFAPIIFISIYDMNGLKLTGRLYWSFYLKKCVLLAFQSLITLLTQWSLNNIVIMSRKTVTAVIST